MNFLFLCVVTRILRSILVLLSVARVWRVPLVPGEDHRDSSVAPQHGDRCPCCTGRAGSLVCGSHLYDIRCSPVEYQTTDFLGSLLQEIFTYSALSGSTVVTCRRQSTRFFGRISHVLAREGGLRIDSTMLVG